MESFLKIAFFPFRIFRKFPIGIFRNHYASHPDTWLLTLRKFEVLYKVESMELKSTKAEKNNSLCQLNGKNPFPHRMTNYEHRRIAASAVHDGIVKLYSNHKGCLHMRKVMLLSVELTLNNY